MIRVTLFVALVAWLVVMVVNSWNMAPAAPEVSALCKDGTVSRSAVRSGTCAGHGGVRQWLK